MSRLFRLFLVTPLLFTVALGLSGSIFPQYFFACIHHLLRMTATRRGCFDDWMAKFLMHSLRERKWNGIRMISLQPANHGEPPQRRPMVRRMDATARILLRCCCEVRMAHPTSVPP
ncbi:hypothetical protein BU24DRAFT_216790 [Aaosphaeria arxii CBS 175.79]|uniref:Secreted protein n=1 Tax=Aaosphaeria arxii CBS 175.79 TaxID=1450172 RepID=A0A6A5XMY0_9PLEO|nr:uncharacterized protein BU24DRAFT_216790 [Aaosphaeria arxii CBS 175.79]KAF2014588.1 hypothetical protein BU24DRAFT_216790 [Aaosphaeria arxii CBS 175.79]